MEAQVVSQFTGLLNDIVAELVRPPARVIPVVPGTAVAWDDCCDGQLTARISDMVPVSSTNQRCAIDYWQATGEVMLMRCALTVDDNGRAPTPADLTAEGAESLADSDVLLKTIAAQEWVDAITVWGARGPEGGCKGIVVFFTFKLDQPS